MKKTPSTEPKVGAVRYTQMCLNFQATMAGPSDLAGFNEPPETGLFFTYVHDFIVKEEIYNYIPDEGYIYPPGNEDRKHNGYAHHYSHQLTHLQISANNTTSKESDDEGGEKLDPEGSSATTVGHGEQSVWLEAVHHLPYVGGKRGPSHLGGHIERDLRPREVTEGRKGNGVGRVDVGPRDGGCAEESHDDTGSCREGVLQKPDASFRAPAYTAYPRHHYERPHQLCQHLHRNKPEHMRGRA